MYKKIILSLAIITFIFGWSLPLYTIKFYPKLDYLIATYLSKMIFTFGPLVGPLFVHYAVLLTDKSFIKNKLYITFCIFNLTIPIFALLGYIEDGVAIYEGKFYPVFGELIGLTHIAQVSLLALVLYLAVKKISIYFKESILEANDRIVMMTLFMVGMAIFCNITSPIILESNSLIFAGPVFILFLVSYILLESMNKSQVLLTLIVESLKKVVFRVPILSSIVYIILVAIYSISKLLRF